MYRFVRSAQATAGRFPEAVRWAKEAAEYINTRDSFPKLRVFTGMFGDVNIVFWEAEHKDLSSIENVFAKLSADQGYWAVVSKATGLFVEGSIRDSVMGSV